MTMSVRYATKLLRAHRLVQAQAHHKDKHLQATFQRRKNGLMRRAMELSVLCGCDIAMFLFAPDDRLSQYTSSEMEGLLDRYSRTCQHPHETRSNQDVRTHHGSLQTAPGLAQEGCCSCTCVYYLSDLLLSACSY